jgi:hypothetical protein
MSDIDVLSEFQEAMVRPPARTALPSIFLVTTEPKPGEEDEFNDWYTHIHCHDVMRLQGSVAVQRYKQSRHQLRYNAAHIGPKPRWLTIYELGDTQQNIDDHLEQCFGDLMPITAALELGAGEDYYYTAIDDGVSALDLFAARGGDVLTVRMNPLPGKEAAFASWYRREYLPRTLRLVGFGAGDLYRLADIQLVNETAPFSYVAVYHLGDAMMAIESLDGHLAQPSTLLDCPLVDGDGVQIAAYTPITGRLTAKQVNRLSPAQRALEDKFRTGMAGRRHMADSFGRLKRV